MSRTEKVGWISVSVGCIQGKGVTVCCRLSGLCQGKYEMYLYSVLGFITNAFPSFPECKLMSRMRVPFCRHSPILGFIFIFIFNSFYSYIRIIKLEKNNIHRCHIIKLFVIIKR